MPTTLLISELAARSGFTPSALRYYEQVGLLAPAQRSPAGYRRYGEATLARLKFIDRAKKLGLPLEEIRELVAVWDRGRCGHLQDRLRAHVTAKSAAVRARIAELTAFAAELDAAYAELGRHTPNGPCGAGCGCADSTPGGASAPEVHELTPTRRMAARPSTTATTTTTATTATTATATDAGAEVPAPVPVACTLATTDQPARLGAWAELLARVRGREAIDGGLRLRFPPDPQLAGRLGELAAREQSCCSHLKFTLHPAGDVLTLDVQAPEHAAGALADIFGASR